MGGMGPPPKPADQRARRNKTVAMTQLPADGRPGRAPKWPLIPDIVTTARRDVWAGKVADLEHRLEELELDGKPTANVERRLDHAREELAILESRLKEQRALETKLWRELWRTPPAVQWERLGWTRDVALFVRHHVLAELGELEAAKEARQWSDRLGLNPLALLRLRWEIADPAPQAGQTRPGSGARGRYTGLRVVGGQAAGE